MSAVDPGMEGGIEQGADNAEEDQSEGDREQQEEADLMQPSRWWFASTAFPLLAGTFGPMATGFNICALVHPWRQTLPNIPHALEGEGHSIPDPTWLVAINVVSLVAALAGNASLLLSMARRLKFSIAQTIFISGFLLAGVLLIADMAALTAKAHYGITKPALEPSERHALSQAFYYAIFAAAIYIIIGFLMCVTVYGALQGHYKKDFHLTASQRTLMLQTMSFIAYLLLGALVYSKIEGWQYLNAVYWADVTLLTVGLGDFSPSTRVGRGLLFPFAIGGILIVGLVIGSIRSLILERGKEKMGARIVEKRRSKAVRNVDEHKQTIKISMFAKADFSTDPGLSSSQKREEEFNVIRKVQAAAQRERQWFALATSSTFALILWLVGAVVFMQAEYVQQWTYLGSLYFSYTSLLTIGYGEFYPLSNSGKAFFVLWSLLAVPSLTILISNMGDTIIKWFSDLTVWVGSITVLPGEGGFRASLRNAFQDLKDWVRDTFKSVTPSKISGDAPANHKKRMDRTQHENMVRDRLAERLASHINQGGKNQAQGGNSQRDDLEEDTLFYNYVLARECRALRKDLGESPPKKYEWTDWEYFLKLMGNQDDPVDFPGQEHPDILVPEPMRAAKGTDSTADEPHESDDTEVASSEEAMTANYGPVDGNIDRQTSVDRHMESRRAESKKQRRKDRNTELDYLIDWSWLSNESPLMSQKSEAEWILDRLSAALERELDRQRKGYRQKPPIGLKDAKRKPQGNGDAEKSAAGARNRE